VQFEQSTTVIQHVINDECFVRQKVCYSRRKSDHEESLHSMASQIMNELFEFIRGQEIECHCLPDEPVDCCIEVELPRWSVSEICLQSEIGKRMSVMEERLVNF
jgi:hypothetical protein